MSDPSDILEKILEGLSDDQRRAVLSKSRYIRVIAGAGAGKTETLMRRIAYLIMVEKVEPSTIVAFTFTVKAAQAMKSRIYRFVDKNKGPINKLGEMYIGTIHGYAKRVLEAHPKYGNYEMLDENKEMAFLMSHGWALGFGGPGYVGRCTTFSRTLNMVLDEMLDEGELAKRAPAFHHAMKKYEGILDEHRLMTFSESIKQAVLWLRDRPSSVRHLFVDEYQDINLAQEELIRLVGRDAGIFVVGDPRQSIYQWRGSDERFFETFAETFKPTEMITIRQNRRSVRSVVSTANEFAGTFATKYERMEGVRDESGLTALAEFSTPEEEAKWIADQIEELKKRPGMKWSDFGLLTRSVRTAAIPLINELRARRIPYIVGGTVGLFNRGEAQVVGRIFSWLSEDGSWPEDVTGRGKQIEGDALLETGLRMWAGATGRSAPENAEDRLRKIKEDLCSEDPGYHNFTQLYHGVLNALGFKDLDYLDPNHAAVMANLGRFHNLLTDYESANRMGGRRTSWRSSLKGLCWFMKTYAISAYEEQPSDDIRGVDAVRVMTVHQVKGLEWPAVFLFAVTRNRFPSSMVGTQQDWWDVPRDMFDVARYEGDKEDERRLFYVALTRARDLLVMSYAGKAGRESEFIDATSGLTGITRVPPEIEAKPTSLTEEMQTLTAGEIIRYNVCPHMYLLGKVWGYQPELDIAIGYGNSLHYSLRRAGELVAKGMSPVDAVADAVENEFHVPFAGGKQFETFKASAKEKLVNFAIKHGGDLTQIEESEYRLEYPVHNATVTGKVDVILRAGGVREVREYKTSKEVITPEELADQVRLYALGLNGIGRQVGRASVAYLEEAGVEPVGIGESEMWQAKEMADRTVERIIKRDFAPTPGEGSCRRCDHVRICRWRT